MRVIAVLMIRMIHHYRMAQINQNMTHGSLFSGIGGFDLAAEWMGWDNIFHCEWNPFGQKVLKHHFPNSISYNDITKTDFSIHAGKIDILTGGFPCQPYSSAGKRLGKADERHLFPEMLRCIKEVKPRYIVGENVRGLVSWGGGLVFNEVCDDLEREGYAVQPFLIPAASVGAPHQRQRIWFVAHSNDKGRSGESREIQKENGEISQWDNDAEFSNSSNGNATNSERIGFKQCEQQGESRCEKRISSRVCINGAVTDSISFMHGANEYGSIRQENGEISGKGTHPIYNAIGSNGNTRIITDSNGIGRGQDDRINNGEPNEPYKDGETRNVADSEQFRLEHGEKRGNIGESKRETQGEGSSFTKQFETNCWARFPTVSPVCGGDDGLPKELDNITFSKWRKESIKAYGNAIVPQVAYQIFKAICNSETIKST